MGGLLVSGVFFGGVRQMFQFGKQYYLQVSFDPYVGFCCRNTVVLLRC